MTLFKYNIISGIIFITFLSSLTQGVVFGFNTTYRQEAIDTLPKVFSKHPRIFLRQKKWKYGPSIEEINQWKDLKPWSYWIRDKKSRRGMEELAIKYLFTKNEIFVPKIVHFLKTQKYWPGYLTTMAICYDWIFNSPSFSENDKRYIENKMVHMGYQALRKGEYFGDMWSHFGYAPVCDVIMAGLALYGRRPEAKKFLAYGLGYLKRNFLPGWQLIGGAWMGGWVYYRYSGIYLIKAILAVTSATDENLLIKIKEHYGDWLQKHMYYLIQTVMPDGSPSDVAGFSYSPYRPGVNLSILMIATAYGNKDGIKFLKDHYKNMDQWWWKGFNFLFFSPEFRKMKIDNYKMPLSMCWGSKGVGYVQMRSGWGSGDAIIEFKCGDYFWSHQFNNQGSFYIYRKGKLAIQSGIYDLYWGDHMLYYYRPTISSNTVIIIDPTETTWIPPGVVRRNRIKTDYKGFIKEFGGQRSCYMLPSLGSAETCFTLKKYLWRKTHQHHFETGDIRKYYYGKDFTYVMGDMTKAYNTEWFSYPNNRPKLDLFTRELLFVDKRFLFVLDKVVSRDSDYEKRWLLHSINEPQINTKIVRQEYPGHRTVYDKGNITIYEGGGKLYVQTILPRNAFIRKVGGGATISRIKTDPKNRSRIRLKGDIKGIFKRLSLTIATDAARVEKWKVEFEDEIHFRVYGSKTGFDGSGNINKNFLSKTKALFIPKNNWIGRAKKGDRIYFSVTSSSNRFWVNGRNHFPDIKRMITILKDGSRVTPGYWRMEVVPKKRKKSDVFLHMLYPCDLHDSPVWARPVQYGDDFYIVSIKDWTIVFSLKPSPLKRLIIPKIHGKKHKIIVLGLNNNSIYRINLRCKRDKINLLKTTTNKGLLYFEYENVCEISLEEK